MPQCKNNNKKTYTGQERTPLGNGYHSSGEKINTKMKGTDNNIYVVKKRKTGVKYWSIDNNSFSKSAKAVLTKGKKK